jgi:hypothetical protein
MLVCLGISGCGSDACGPDTCRCGVTLENAWPNGNGAFWSYKYTVRTWDYDPCPVYASEEDVPAAPSLDTIENLLGSQPIGPNVETMVGTYEMMFDGDSTTMSGVTAQRLRETAYLPEATGGLCAGTAPRAAFLTKIFLLKPSARDAILASGALGPEPAAELIPSPTLIHGGVWEKTDEYIGTYGDIDTLLAYKFLEADLCAGCEFTFQLLPRLAPDVLLHCRVLGETTVETETGVPSTGLRCLYMIDFGKSESLRPSTAGGWWRAIDYGEVVYVRNVGPVYSYERNLVCVGETLGRGAGDMELSLTATGGSHVPIP